MNVEAQITDVELSERMRAALHEHICAVLNVGAEFIDADSAFIELGFDSMTLTQFCNVLNQTYELDLVPPVFFDYQDSRRLADFLVREHRAKVVPRLCPRLADPQCAPKSSLEPIPMAEDRVPTSDIVRNMDAAADSLREPIAIVGMSGCFPAAPDVDSFWKNLVDGVDCITEIPADRWDWRALHGDPTREADKTDSRWGGFIDGVAEFDSLFFGISPGEAEVTDPQQRLLMEHAWKCIEDAGYSSQAFDGTRTGVFVGVSDNGYSRLVSQVRSPGAFANFGGPNRLSFFLNLRGPSEPVDTACSSSLIAVHRAVQAILAGECDAAIAAGVNTIISPGAHLALSRMGVLSPDGRCKTFSARANGYVRGEGIGVLLLKPLSAAERDSDQRGG